MMNLNLFNGQTFTPPDADTLAKLSPAMRAHVGHIADAAALVADAQAAVELNERDLRETREEIKALDKIMPRETRIDLVRQQMAETQKRRMGL